MPSLTRLYSHKHLGIWAVAVSLLVHWMIFIAAPWRAGHPKVVWVQAGPPMDLSNPVDPQKPEQSIRKIAQQLASRATSPRLPTNGPTATASEQANAPQTDLQATPTEELASEPPVPPPTSSDSSASTEPVSTAPEAPPLPKGPVWLPGQPATLPGPQSVSYKVEGLANNLTYHASASLTWLPQDDGRYVLTYKVGAFLLGSRSQNSQGMRGPSGLEPHVFVDQSRRTQTTTVDLELKQVKLPANPQPQPWEPGVQDRLSVFVQLGAWVAQAPAVFESDQNFKLAVWSSREVETWLVVSQGRQKLATPYGEQWAIQLTRMPLHPNDARVDMWFVPEWGALPVQIVLVEANGNRAEQRLNDMEPKPPLKSP